MDPIDRLTDKFLCLNDEVRRELWRAKVREELDRMVLRGELALDPQNPGTYIRLFEDGEENA
jgi:hypothetical protein